MTSNYTCVAGLIYQETGIQLIHSNRRSEPLPIHDYCIPSLLEILTRHTSIEKAYRAYQEFRQLKAVVDPSVLASIQCDSRGHVSRNALLFIYNKIFVCPADVLNIAYHIATITPTSAASSQLRTNEMMNLHNILDLTTQSRNTPLIASTMHAHHISNSITYPDLSFDQFVNVIKRLSNDGLLTVSVGAIDFGDFKRLTPFCSEFGHSRGTPIDRYYLNKFIDEISNDVVGDALEVGGVKRNQQLYGFMRAKSYRALDISKRAGVDIVGDVHNPNIVENNSLDSVIIFNVLEHCEKPGVVVENIYNWLKDGGKVFCMVPNAQRIHGTPKDFWRPLPDAIDSIFARFPTRKLFIYGNPVATIASLMGVAAEELSSEDLDSANNEYPVATCIFAQKE